MGEWSRIKAWILPQWAPFSTTLGWLALRSYETRGWPWRLQHHIFCASAPSFPVLLVDYVQPQRNRIPLWVPTERPGILLPEWLPCHHIMPWGTIRRCWNFSNSHFKSVFHTELQNLLCRTMSFCVFAYLSCVFLGLSLAGWSSKLYKPRAGAD